jgi:hypothetical protein
MISCLHVFALLSIVQTVFGDAAGLAEYNKVKTGFGYVLVAPEDIPAAIDEGYATRLAARKVLLLKNVTFAVVEEGSGDFQWGATQDGFKTYTWTFPHGSRRFKPRPAITLLRHEVAHDLFARHLVPTTSEDQYGTDAPDWLDEMAAVAFEGVDQRLSRTRDARSKGLLTLPSLLRMAHPELGAPVVREAGQTFAAGPVSSDQTIPFYATVSCFYEFLSEKTGNEGIVAELAAAFKREESLELWLLGRLGYSKRRQSLEQMDGDFRRWFAGRPAHATAK